MASVNPSMIEFRGRLPITVLIAAKNEAANLPRCLSSLSPVKRVVLLDSHSTDGTVELARNASIEVVQFNYEGGYPRKRQWALENLAVETPWIFLLDADELVPGALWREIEKELSQHNDLDAYLIKKGFHFLGRRMRFGGFSFSAVLLFRKGKVHFERLLEDTSDGLDMEVHERVIVNGKIGRLRTPLIHEDFKGLEAYIDRHNKYSTWEAKLRRQFMGSGVYGIQSITPRFFGNAQERRRLLKVIIMRMPFEAQVWFLYHYLFHLGFLEGRAGLIACQIRASYISQVRAKVFEANRVRP